jgi:hypothetical protein
MQSAAVAAANQQVPPVNSHNHFFNIVGGSSVFSPPARGQLQVQHPVPSGPAVDLSGSLFSALPPILRPVAIGERQPFVKTVADFSEALSWWTEHEPGLTTDHSFLTAAHRYKDHTLNWARTVGVKAALDYHLSAVNASVAKPQPRYNFVTDGSFHVASMVSYIQPVLSLQLHQAASAKRSYGRQSGGDKRPPTPAAGAAAAANNKRSRDADADCYLPNHEGHSNAECRTQATRKKSKSGASSSAPPPASSDG